jgi:hypothetical protein
MHATIHKQRLSANITLKFRIRNDSLNTFSCLEQRGTMPLVHHSSILMPISRSLRTPSIIAYVDTTFIWPVCISCSTRL